MDWSLAPASACPEMNESHGSPSSGGWNLILWTEGPVLSATFLQPSGSRDGTTGIAIRLRTGVSCAGVFNMTMSTHLCRVGINVLLMLLN